MHQAQGQGAPLLMFVQRGDGGARHFLNLDATRKRVQQEFGLRIKCGLLGAAPHMGLAAGLHIPLRAGC